MAYTLDQIVTDCRAALKKDKGAEGRNAVRKFIEMSAKELNWGGIDWEGEGLNEIGKRKDNGKIVIRISSEFFRPAEVETLLGNAEKARNQLGWEPTTSLEQLVKEMIEEDMKLAKKI